uniref:protein-tyrosine-phosphatase n=1 Tax=Romanomermis culicivorax TaxID=13658 RepID=A0A915IE93_ROMCU
MIDSIQQEEALTHTLEFKTDYFQLVSVSLDQWLNSVFDEKNIIKEKQDQSLEKIHDHVEKKIKITIENNQVAMMEKIKISCGKKQDLKFALDYMFSNFGFRHIRIYMKRQNSRGSINSTASVGLGDVFGNSSRPVSAESTSGTDAFLTNVQVRSPSRLVPSLSRESCLVVNSSAKSAPGSAPRSSSIPAGLRARPLIGSFAELVCRPAPYLYMGGIEAANNANLLCRLNIESIVDVSNIERTKLPREKRSDCPCLCRLETAHCRSFFTAKIDENDNSDLITTFEDANEFIQKAILCGKSVLVHSYYGRNRCAVFVVQHLIKSQHLPLYRAIQFSATRNVVIKISQEKTVFSDDVMDVMIFKVFDVIHHTKV